MSNTYHTTDSVTVEKDLRLFNMLYRDNSEQCDRRFRCYSHGMRVGRQKGTRCFPRRNNPQTLLRSIGSTSKYSPCNMSSIIFVLLVHCLSLASGQNTPEMPPIVFTQQPQAGSPEIQGNTKVLLCQATGFPPPVYRWKKDGNFITDTNITDTSLKISNIERSDDGEYQCIASNNPGAILSNKVHVRVAYMVPFASLSSTERTVDQGQAYIMDPPSLESYPNPTIKWFEISNEMHLLGQESQHYHITLQHQLVILETQMSYDRKVYKARATNSYTGQTSDSQMFVLHVQSVGSLSDDIPPEIIIAPTHTTAVQGDDDSVTLECVANARPINYLSMNWYRRSGTERTPIEQDYTKYLFSLFRRRLTIKIPDTSDSGVYECEVELNRPGATYPTDTATANLTVLVKPSFATPPPSDISRDYGSQVEIPCHAVGIPAPNIVWYRNAEIIDFTEDDRFSLLSSGSLHIDEVNPTDGAVYQCFASNGAGEINGATWLKVLSSVPEIIARPENQSIIAGDSARLMCDVTGAPRPNVVWYRVLENHNEREYLTDDNPRVNILDRELLIPVTIVGDSGRYVCNATNTKGMDWAEAYVKVSLRTRIVGPPQDASVIKGSIHYMPCEVDRDPAVQVEWRWYQNDQHIPLGDPRRRIWEDGRLEIRSVRNEDIGMYRCDVTSMAGDDTASARVQVIELPYPPTISSMTLNPDDVRAVDITWQAGFDGNTPIRYYIMQYRLVPTGETLLPNEAWQIASSSVGASERSFTVTGLQPARTYQFRISAVNDVGEGPASESSAVIEMPQQPPSGPPRGVVASPRSESSIILQWQPPDENRWNGPLQGYVIRYKPSGYPDSTLTYEPLDLANLYILHGLIVFTEYEVAVAAYNAEGTGVYSDTITVRTYEGSPSQAPRNIMATAVSSTKIRLQWLPPDPQRINGINQGYKIEARRTDMVDPDVFLTVPSNTSNMLGQQTAFLDNLHKFTQYEIKILCFTSAGDGPMSDPVNEQTMEDVPDQVGSLTFANILDTSLQVIWTPPENINGFLVGYTLTYMKAGHVITMVTQEVGATTLNYTITGLTATTTYTIEVYARTRVGPGQPRSANIDSGIPPELPEAPLNLAITNIQATSVLLQFVPGFSGHTSISTWIVEGRVDAADWEVIYRESAPEATSILVQNLRPYTSYVLRLIAENVAGQSDPSAPTREFQTIQAPPSGPPQEVTVRAVNETAIRATWKPLDSRLWNGEGRGYLVQYRISGTVTYNTIEVQNENANSYIFTHLEEYTEYDVRVASRNNVGSSVYSPLASDRTMESVPSSGPFIVEADALTSTSIRLTWTDVAERDQNGLILGYKVFYSAIEEDGPQLSILDTEDSATFTVRLTDLKKFTLYRIQILAYTRIGDGVLSEAPAQVRTHEDVPGPPSGIYFPEVTHSTARVLWGEPTEPNGIIIGYHVAYRKKNLAPSYTVVSENLSNDTFAYYVTSLERTTYYDFNVTARTQLGWGVPGNVEVYTIINRRIPDPPSRPSIGMSQVGADWVTINWQPGNDGYGPIRNYTIQYLMLQPDNLAMYVDLPHYVPPNVTAFTVEDLHANTRYQFRIAANNDLGVSEYSEPSEVITTKQAAPSSPPEDLEVIPQTTTSVLVTWRPPPPNSWNGNQLGYQVWYSLLSQREGAQTQDSYQQITIAYPNTRVTLPNLVPNNYYEVKVNAFNSKGHGPFCRPVDVYVGEAVPTESPINFDAVTLGSTEILASWNPPPSSSWNGDLLGYKIFYWREEVPGQHVKTVAATETQAILEDLEMFTEYTLVMLAFNAAGDGPNTTIPITALTTEGVPGSPGPLKFIMTSLTSLNVSWTAPTDSNGYIESYEVSYYQDTDVDGESRRVQERLNGDKHSYIAHDLTENVLYVFSVKARTSIDWGEPRYGNITTGPQAGSPGQPSQPTLESSETAVTLTWTNGYDGDSPISGYIIQGLETNDDTWKTLLRTSNPEPKVSISYYNLNLKTEYQFRVIALNAQGVSAPSIASESLRTIDLKDGDEKFYEQWWFAVIVALTGFIFVIIVISFLCLTGQQRRKSNAFKEQIPKSTIRLEENHLNHNMHQMQPMPTQEAEEAGFGTLESASSRRSHRRPPVPRLNSLPPYTRSPPRPSPGMVNYNSNSDEETKQFPDDGSSVSEKPSDISSSDASDSEPETEKGYPPPDFTNHYVNGDVRQSWQRHQNPQPPIYNYTDSEQDSQYAVTLNGGHVIMNNMAGSRAPLPGFSSFV